MEVRQQAVRGIIEGDHIRLFEAVSLANGTVVEVTIAVESRSEEARDRQRDLLREGIHLGGPPYPSREELHER
jgi:hypothetical protein